MWYFIYTRMIIVNDKTHSGWTFVHHFDSKVSHMTISLVDMGQVIFVHGFMRHYVKLSFIHGTSAHSRSPPSSGIPLPKSSPHHPSKPHRMPLSCHTLLPNTWQFPSHSLAYRPRPQHPSKNLTFLSRVTFHLLGPKKALVKSLFQGPFLALLLRLQPRQLWRQRNISRRIHCQHSAPLYSAR